jgi:hypothetical protein
MHPLIVSPAVAQEIRIKGEVDPADFRRSVRHWFPGGWSICNELKRRNNEFPARLDIQQTLGMKAWREVYKLMSSEAMRTAVETAFSLRFALESENVIVAYDVTDTPTRNFRRTSTPKMRAVAEVKANEWRTKYPKGYGQIAKAVGELGKKNWLAVDDSEISDDIRKEVELLMGIEPARRALESWYRIKFVFLLPCRICMARDGYEEHILKFTRPLEQIETISVHPAAD